MKKININCRLTTIEKRLNIKLKLVKKALYSNNDILTVFIFNNFNYVYGYTTNKQNLVDVCNKGEICL